VADAALSSRDLLRAILERSGYEVFEVSEGEHVVACAREFRPDVVILDLKMPRLDGFSIARTLRECPGFEEIPVVALAASLPEVMPEQMKEAGFTGFLIKPIHPGRLRECVACLLAKR
jgi:CheY-like chemotaxis protein